MRGEGEDGDALLIPWRHDKMVRLESRVPERSARRNSVFGWRTDSDSPDSHRSPQTQQLGGHTALTVRSTHWVYEYAQHTHTGWC